MAGGGALRRPSHGRGGGWKAWAAATFAAAVAAFAPGPAAAELPSHRIVEALTFAAPGGWVLVSAKGGALPQGHHHGTAYDGEAGALYILAGPQRRALRWRDDAGDWHRADIGREAIEIWIMPPGYGPGRQRVANPRGAEPAVALGGPEYPGPPLFGREASYVPPQALVSIVGQATATRWDPRTPASWLNWREDIARVLGEVR